MKRFGPAITNKKIKPIPYFHEMIKSLVDFMSYYVDNIPKQAPENAISIMKEQYNELFKGIIEVLNITEHI